MHRSKRTLAMARRFVAGGKYVPPLHPNNSWGDAPQIHAGEMCFTVLDGKVVMASKEYGKQEVSRQLLEDPGVVSAAEGEDAVLLLCAAALERVKGVEGGR